MNHAHVGLVRNTRTVVVSKRQWVVCIQIMHTTYVKKGIKIKTDIVTTEIVVKENKIGIM